MSRHPATALVALLFTLTVLALGYADFGFWTMLIFTWGFLGGLFLWLLFLAKVAVSAIKYSLALALFVLHRVEEYLFGFFDRLAVTTGTQKPEVASWEIVLLLLLSVRAWLLMPWPMGRGYRKLAASPSYRGLILAGVSDVSSLCSQRLHNRPFLQG